MIADSKTLVRFVEAQAPIYADALAEIRRGVKRSHWMWFVFPQLEGLGRSQLAEFYGIRSIDEARAYLEHPLLGPRYLECVAALQNLAISDPVAVFGEVDAVKLRSSLTLFEVAQPLPLFTATLDRWFGGSRDQATLRVLDPVRWPGGSAS
ncbi:DUF1810 domain-containing protein [Allosphingosinicella deserti]|uniref:DUF1810 domain-containing protein n=1 Tax=Allosphingosinicella deserti TaxID=2116704 RepID=A0A2P7QE91_9SPHN|nr:DUF1810 domain-containing protein [Sphingomonas deserti]PSJ36292.1 DUF1810 domain-containing protein [Sphingomonas deserti]